jgi:uncharacterized membrane protein YfcA
LIPGGVIGSYFGSGIAVTADGALLRILFGILMTVSGVFSLSGAVRLLVKRRKKKKASCDADRK